MLVARWVVAVLLVAEYAGPLSSAPGAMAEDSPAAPKSIHKACGKCPDGYAVTGVTEASGVCKDGEPGLVECVPLGMNILAVCGACPEGYREVGSSFVPARCGNEDGGRMSQCQLQTLQSNFPDPTQGGKVCPPDCAGTPVPGQGALPLPPRFPQAPEKP